MIMNIKDKDCDNNDVQVCEDDENGDDIKRRWILYLFIRFYNFYRLCSDISAVFVLIFLYTL